MKLLTLPLFLPVFLAVLCSCGQQKAVDQLNSNKLRFATLDAVDRDTVPVLKDFRSLFPDSTIQYLSFAGADFPSLSADTFLYGRYTLNMRLPVFYSNDHKSVLRYGDPEFFLCEIKYIRMEGETIDYYDAGDQQWHFGRDVWKRIFDAGRDFAVVGFDLKKGSPVKNFDALRTSIMKNSRSAAIQAAQDAANLRPATDKPKAE